MCGLATLARFSGNRLDQADLAVLTSMAQVLAHRGPDETQHLHGDAEVGMSFTRLSLVDPEHGGQPLISDDGDVVLIANGEVYNHLELERALPGARMRTGSDCEVLVHLYQRHGAAFLDDVRGMFGLILWDRRARRLVLARDRFGVKPLFFHRDAQRIVVSSEIKALFEDAGTPRQVDWRGALTEQVFSADLRFADGPVNTWFAGVESVAPGELVTVDLVTGDVDRRPYWSPPPAGVDPLVPSDAFDEFAHLLDAAVTETLMADVDLGLFLSGGVDSAAVAAIAGRSADLHCFTTASASTWSNGDAQFARSTAQHLGLPYHSVVFPRDRHPSADEWRSLLWLTETPLCGPEQWYKFELHRYARQVRPTIKAMLLGGAADEYLGGYTPLLSGSGDWAGFERTLASLQLSTSLPTVPGLATWFGGDGSPALLRPEALLPPADAYDSFLRWKMRDVHQYNCWHEDRTAGGNGIEARVPFLDNRLVDFVAAVPPHQREQFLWDKRLVREATRRLGLLPEAVVDRVKEPFYDGDHRYHTHRVFLRMLTAGGSELVEQALETSGAKEHLDADAVRESLAGLVAGRRSLPFEVLLRVVNLGLLESMVLDLPGPLPTTPAGPVLLTLTGEPDAQDSAAAELVLPSPQSQVVALVPDTVLLSSEAGVVYVAQDGELRFELDPAQDAVMIGVLTALRTDASVSELAAALSADVATVSELVEQGLVAGVLTERLAVG